MSSRAELKRILRSAPKIDYYDGSRYSEPITNLNKRNLLGLQVIDKVYTRLKLCPDSFQVDQENLKVGWEKIDWEWSDGKLKLASYNDPYKVEIYMELMFGSLDSLRQIDEEKLVNATMRWEKNVNEHKYRHAVFVGTSGYPKLKQYLFYSGVGDSPLILNQFGKENSWFQITKESYQIPVNEILLPFWSKKNRVQIKILWENVFNIF